MSLKKEDLLKGIEVEDNLKNLVDRLCDIYLQNRDGNCSINEWKKCSSTVIEVIKKTLQSLPSSYWKEGIFQLAAEYFYCAIQEGNVNIKDCEDYIRKKIDPW